MSLGESTAAARKAAIESLKFKKTSKDQTPLYHTPVTPSSSTSSTQHTTFRTPPLQSRDASIPSRYFPSTPFSPGNVLVPNSSPPSDATYRHHQSKHGYNSPGPILGLNSSDAWGHSSKSIIDPLAASSGFLADKSTTNASLTRSWGPNGYTVPPAHDPQRGEPPRKRLNRGASPSDSLDFASIPGSPEIQRLGQRKRPVASRIVSSASEDDSLAESTHSLAGTSKSRIVRGHHSPHSDPPAVDPAQLDAERFTKFKFLQPEYPLDSVRAAWQQASGDFSKAEALLHDPNWRPPSSPGKTSRPPTTETGRVKEIDEAHKAERARVREMGKKSLIYQTRVALDGKPHISTPPSSKVTLDLTKSSPVTPPSPEVIQRPIKRLKRKVVQSDSEPESVGSDDDNHTPSRLEHVGGTQRQTLHYFNTAAAEALQELSGCTLEQANTITGLRPFSSIDDLNTKLGQGKKKAGPSGISPRIFEECNGIFQGYGKVDNILANCEKIGATLRKEIANWTTNGSTKLHGREGSTSSRTSPIGSDIGEEGSLSLRSQAVLASKKPDYYMSKQPDSLADTVQLKEYQLMGINWLNLLYRKKLSCILADEMGLGKTVQVISFLAHLQEQGRKGPHLIVVPSSTLENWLREFKRFAPGISVQTYYAGKEQRPALRESLRQSQRCTQEGGWEVLVTTYNLAQGDDQDRKFFRRIDWDTCVFDEGHVLKNFQSQRYQALLRYESRWRLLLTGTPLQNNLQELVSLMNFILPQQFAQEMESLRAVFKVKGDSKVTLLAQERVSRAKKMLTPFVLRRRKDQVLQDLPKKSERIEWCEMTSLQKSIYHDALRRSRKTIFDMDPNSADSTDAPTPPTNGRGGKPPKKKTRANARTKDKLYLENSSNVLMDLRKAALHPMLFRRRFTDEALTSIAKLLLKEPDFKKRGAVFDYVKEDMEVMTDAELQLFVATYKSTRKYLQQEDCYVEAGKVKVLLRLLKRYRSEDRRVLIFSQFTQVLDILQKVLDKRGIKYLLLTGSTPVDVRQSLVDEFTDDETIPVFLLSTKAGGMGINLTAASVVIMFDQDFNPHNDKQAQDRAYRIGQKRDVEVVKLITKGSIEEDMLELGRTKLALDEAVAGEGEEEQIEREVKTSLMNVVRKKLEEVQDVDEDVTGKGKGKDKMDIDEDDT